MVGKCQIFIVYNNIEKMTGIARVDQKVWNGPELMGNLSQRTFSDL